MTLKLVFFKTEKVPKNGGNFSEKLKNKKIYKFSFSEGVSKNPKKKVKKKVGKFPGNFGVFWGVFRVDFRSILDDFLARFMLRNISFDTFCNRRETRGNFGKFSGFSGVPK